MGFESASSPVPSNRHADINIFTVASGLLYEVTTPSSTLQCSLAAFRFDHDTQRDEAHQEQREVLVYRKYSPMGLPTR